MKKNRCMFCGASATLLCDGNLGFPPRQEDGKVFIDPWHPYTCDAQMCDACGTQVAKIFVCGKKPYAGIHTTDHCPICIQRLPAYPQNNRRIISTPAQAETIRKAHWASYASNYQRHLQLTQGGGQQCLKF